MCHGVGVRGWIPPPSMCFAMCICPKFINEKGILKIAQQIKPRAANFEVSSGHKGMNNCEREFSLYENKIFLPLEYKVMGGGGRI